MCANLNILKSIWYVSLSNLVNHSRLNNIVIRGMTHEHHSNFYPWIKLKNKISVRNIPIDSNGFFKLDDLKSNLDKNTKLVAISHALYNTGSILPAEKISTAINKQIPFFIDSAQTIGCIGTHDVSKLGCDFMSFNGSKWLCGPMGTGLFYCKKESSELLEPKTIGGESAIIENDNNLVFKELPEKFQTGFISSDFALFSNFLFLNNIIICTSNETSINYF